MVKFLFSRLKIILENQSWKEAKVPFNGVASLGYVALNSGLDVGNHAIEGIRSAPPAI